MQTVQLVWRGANGSIDAKHKTIQRFARRNASDFKEIERLVEIKVCVKVFNKNTNEEQEDEIWWPGEMVEGGKYNLMGFLKSKTQELKRKIEDRPKPVLDMKLDELVIENFPESITLFEHIKLFAVV